MHVRRHVRSLLIALTVLAISAGLVAGREMPAAAADGLAKAAEAAGKVVPVGPPTEEAAPDPTDEPVDEPEAEDEDEAPAPEGGEAADNHGSVVSEAAKADTPDGFKNHGEYVSSVAKSDAGKPEKATDEGRAATGKAKSAAAKSKPKGGER